jgi:hypothetical protein
MKADTLALVQTLSNGMADSVTSEKYYNDVCFELAHENWFVEASLVPVTEGERTVSIDQAVGPGMGDILGLIYDDVDLDMAMLNDIESIDPYWRDAFGYPRTYVVEDVNQKSIQLHPRPQVTSNPNLGNFGLPLGQDYPTYNVAAFYNYAPLDPQQPWYYLELLIALRVLSLEFSRESDHVDSEFAQSAQALYGLFKSLLA